MYTLAIVDDDELIRLGLKSVVNWERLGFEVIGVYPNALEALEVLRKTTVDVVLTDIKMPQMSGLELIEQAKKYNPQIRSIVISGYSEFELAQKALQLGVDDYLLKPLGQERINTTFSNLKLSLDNSDLVSSDDGKYLKAEYKLMKLLSQKIYVEPLFENENVLELVAIKFMPHFETAGVREQLGICMEYVAKNMLPYVHLLHQDILVVLLPQELLNSYLVEIKKELLHYSNISYCLAVGKEAYSKEEIISSYWTAMELIKEHQEPQRNCIIYYETKDSMNRKDWQFVQSMQEELIKDIENRMSGNVEVTLKALNDKMLTFKTEDVYYYYSNIVARLIKYFKIQGEHNFIYGGRQFYCVEEEKKLEILQRDFNQDIGNILRILHENSDTMQNFIVNNSKKLFMKNIVTAN